MQPGPLPKKTPMSATASCGGGKFAPGTSSLARTLTSRGPLPTGGLVAMGVRFWSARTTQLRLPDYLRHFNEHVLPHLRAKEGFLEARVLTQSDGVVVAM